MRTTSFQEETFTKNVDAWVLNAITDGIGSFPELLQSLPGVYPTDLVSSLRRLKTGSQVPNEILRQAFAKSEEDDLRGATKESRSRLPVPHPLDFDWRFSRSTSDSLLDRACSLSSRHGLIGLMGAPTLLARANARGLHQRMWLIDSSNAMTRHCAENFPTVPIFPCNIMMDQLPRTKAAVIIADPPWYREHIQTFLWAAAMLSNRHAHIIVTLPPLGTRPGLDREREFIFRWIGKLGLKVVSLEERGAEYLSPPFERNALAACGLSNLPTTWRHGAVLHLAAPSLRRVPRPNTLEEKPWAEEVLQGVRFRIRHGQNGKFQSPFLRSIVSGDILPTVSRRDPRRRLVDVWTSGNRVYKCSGSGILVQVLRAMATGVKPEGAVTEYVGRSLTHRELKLIGMATSQVSGIIQLEAADHRKVR